MNVPCLGDVLAIKTSYASTRLVRLISVDGKERLLGADGAILEGERLMGPRATVLAWRRATTEETIAYEATLQANVDADRVSTHGALALVRRLRMDGVEGIERDDRICSCIDELRRRGKSGAASQLAACRFDDSGRYSIVHGLEIAREASS